MSANAQRPCKKILVVSEGDGSRCIDAAVLLKTYNIYIDFTMNALQADSSVRENVYDMILIDCGLKGNLGVWETIWMLKTIVPDARIAVMAETIDKALKQKAASYGILHFFQKPIQKRKSINELIEIIFESTSPCNTKAHHHIWSTVLNMIPTFLRMNTHQTH